METAEKGPAPKREPSVFRTAQKSMPFGSPLTTPARSEAADILLGLVARDAPPLSEDKPMQIDSDGADASSSALPAATLSFAANDLPPPASKPATRRGGRRDAPSRAAREAAEHDAIMADGPPPSRARSRSRGGRNHKPKRQAKNGGGASSSRGGNAANPGAWGSGAAGKGAAASASASSDGSSGDDHEVLPDAPIGCNCRKSRCLKLYCQCFAAGIMCEKGSCKCDACLNCQEHIRARDQAVRSIKVRSILRRRSSPAPASSPHPHPSPHPPVLCFSSPATPAPSTKSSRTVLRPARCTTRSGASAASRRA